MGNHSRSSPQPHLVYRCGENRCQRAAVDCSAGSGPPHLWFQREAMKVEPLFTRSACISPHIDTRMHVTECIEQIIDTL